MKIDLSINIILHCQKTGNNKIAYVSRKKTMQRPFTAQPCIPFPPGPPIPRTIQPSPLSTHLPSNLSQTTSLLCLNPSVDCTALRINENIKKTGELDFKSPLKFDGSRSINIVERVDKGFCFTDSYQNGTFPLPTSLSEVYFPFPSQFAFYHQATLFNADRWQYQYRMNCS